MANQNVAELNALPPTGKVGDSHTQRMAKTDAQIPTTFIHKHFLIIPFSRTDDIKTLIINHPETKIILFTFGSNDIDSCYITLWWRRHLTDMVNAFVTVAIDSYEYGATPYFIQIIPRTTFRSDIGITDFFWLKHQIETRVTQRLSTRMKHSVFIPIDHLVALSKDGIHLTEDSYIKITETCAKHIAGHDTTPTRPVRYPAYFSDPDYLDYIVEKNDIRPRNPPKIQSDDDSTTEEPTAASGAIRKRPRTTSSTDDMTPTNSEWAKKITTLSKRFTKFTITNGRLQLRSDQPTTKTKTVATQTTLSQRSVGSNTDVTLINSRYLP